MTAFKKSIEVNPNPVIAVKEIEDYIKYMTQEIQRVIDVQQREIAALQKKVAEMESTNG